MTATNPPSRRMTITIDDPNHVRLKQGAVIRIGNNDQLKEAGHGTMRGAWQVVVVYPPEPGRQRYDVEPAGLNRRQMRALAKVKQKNEEK
jgi:hypothetical protein